MGVMGGGGNPISTQCLEESGRDGRDKDTYAMYTAQLPGGGAGDKDWRKRTPDRAIENPIPTKMDK